MKFFFFLLFCACATITGPEISQEEVKKFTEELRLKSLNFKLNQIRRVFNLVNKILLAIPSEEIKNYQPYLGLAFSPLNDSLKKIYNFSQKEDGLLIIAVAENSSAQKIGLLEGDLLLSLKGKKIKNFFDLEKISSSLNIGEEIEIEVLRNNRIFKNFLKIEKIPFNLNVVLVDIEEVNAATDGKNIYVTSGLMHFIKSDDELAAVVSHEIAHIVRNHVVKMQGINLINNLAIIALDIFFGSTVSQGADFFTSVFQARYSRDLEREADYFGTKYMYLAGFNVEICATFMERFAVEIPKTLTANYFSTHPSSPERTLRIKKIIEELKKGEK